MKSTHEQQKKGKLKYNANRVNISIAKSIREQIRAVQNQYDFTIDEALIFLLELQNKKK